MGVVHDVSGGSDPIYTVWVPTLTMTGVAIEEYVCSARLLKRAAEAIRDAYEQFVNRSA